jgi:lysozyme
VQAVPAKVTRVYIPAKERLLPAVVISGGYWKAGRFLMGTPQGPTILHDEEGHIVSAVMEADTAVTGIRVDSLGTYRGQMNRLLQASGQGTYDALDGTHYEGFWQYGKRDGFGFESSPTHQVRVGIWKKGRFLGERLRYTTERIYGIDISRHQHEKGRKRYSINWNDLRITSLGPKHNAEGQTFPVSFVYIKSTEGTTVRNRYFIKDYAAARAQGLRTGAYHFFSLTSPALAQATYFVNHTLFRPGDFPPVLDVEPTEAQIRKIGGTEELLRRVRIFMEYVEKRTGMKPILYINQGFVNRHLANAADIKQRYNVWIARYGEYKPDVKLVYWQLTPDGRVNGITGPVDINVFNGYQGQWDEFCRTGFHK